jgi:hypothetical protein
MSIVSLVMDGATGTGDAAGFTSSANAKFVSRKFQHNGSIKSFNFMGLIVAKMERSFLRPTFWFRVR